MLPLLCYIYFCAHIRTYIYNFILYLRRFLSIVLSFPFAEKGHFYHVIRVWLFSTVFFLFYFTISLSLSLLFCGEKKEGRHTLKYCWWIFRFTTYNRLFGWKNNFFPSFATWSNSWPFAAIHKEDEKKEFMLKGNLCIKAGSLVDIKFFPSSFQLFRMYTYTCLSVKLFHLRVFKRNSHKYLMNIKCYIL